MKTSPASFGTLMCFSINNKPSASIPDMLKLSFNRNPNLRKYKLQDTFQYTDDKPDGTVHNASSNFSEFLDRLHKKHLPKGSKKVFLTEAEFYVNPYDTQKKYFVTAATNNDEARIFKALRNTKEFITVRLSYKH